MNQHADRAHATWSASATARLWACPGSLKLAATVEGAGKSGSSPAALWGTSCHELAERCLNTGFDAATIANRVEFTKNMAVEPDEEMIETAQVYVDYVQELRQRAKWTKIEQRFSLDAIDPPFDAGGTADALAYLPAEKLLEVVDLKGGRGVVVEVKDNPQLRTYALGAVLAHPGLDLDRVRVTIVQPRVGHADGRIRSEEFHIVDLMEWTADLLGAMRAADAPDAPLVAGNHCKFCPAAAVCPALAKKSELEAAAYFQPIPEVQTLTVEQIVRILDHADMIQDWLNAVRAHAHSLAEGGVEVPGYQLVAKRATRKWADEDRARTALYLEADLTDADMFVPKMKSPAQIEKLIGKDRFKEISVGLVSAESSGTNLVSSTKTSRPAVKGFFQPIEG